MDPAVGRIHLLFLFAEIFLFLWFDRVRLVRGTVYVVAPFGGIVLALELLDAAGPPQSMVDLWSLVLLQNFFGELRQLLEHGKCGLALLREPWYSIYKEYPESYIAKEVPCGP